MQIDIIGIEETGDIDNEYNTDGTIKNLVPVKDSEKFFFTLGFPDGSEVQVQVTKAVYELFLEEVKNASNCNEMS